MDGSDPANDWQGWIPYDQNPTVKNPARGFVSSANQASTDASYPYYINWQFGNYDRGKRINNLLGQMKKATVDSIRMMQSDNYSMRAHDILPAMLTYIDPSKLTNDQVTAYVFLKKWTYNFNADAIGASVFDAWWTEFYTLTWANHFKGKVPMKLPSGDRTEQLLIQDPNSALFDDPKTSTKETAADIVNRAFISSVNNLIHKYGKPGKNWQWGMVKQTFINHLANLPGFGTGQFSAGGAGSVINALRDGNGPSWRMVVQLGPQVKGYGVLPGGESGNPGSFYYDNMLQTWKDGRLNELLFLQSVGESSKRIQSTLTLSSK
jgi:penicillin amidase